MEPITQTILTKSIASVTVSGVQSLRRKFENSLFRNKEIERVIFDGSDFDPLIEENLDSIEREISNLGENSKINCTGCIKTFLNSTIG
ncbi:MAG: hypothetical protein PHF18_14810 [Methanosarcina sp.]|uniref:hypothetical protein n=1 Tax=Methanosarcina sp. TaxID=2213 RepID=UPI002620E0B1|nr:hypothetical protein [Methanosarcina sp.]MDD3248100.1 hypothetical protein [Methanosarcina sp.]